MRSLLSVLDIENEVEKILDIASDFKAGKIEEKPLEGQKLAMIFQKSSTRTRVSFEVGMYELGGTALFLSNKDIQLGRGEPISDTAKVLSRMVDGIMIRAIEHNDVVEFAKEADIPIINGLTNLEHPCQALADMLTVKEHKGNFDGKFVYFGDGNNVCNSLMLICACLGMDFTVACPDKYQPNEKIIKEALRIAKNNNSTITITSDVKEAAKDADVFYTDVWVSMGDEAEAAQRELDFKDYQVRQELIDLAKEDVIFMHCLPAIRGQEVTSEVIDGPHSVIFDEAENRLHAQKAVMYYFMKELLN
ncbi:MAG: ornithine carbamoyltransferase [archaeon]|nr:ornithine carbamoyltransferase [archaeon]